MSARTLSLALLVGVLAFIPACGDAPAAVGTARLELTVAPANACPSIASAVISPAAAALGSTMFAAATAVDPDPGDRVTFSWSPAAAFAAPSSATTTFTCTAPGPQALTLTVSDGHRPTACATSVSLPVTCQ